MIVYTLMDEEDTLLVPAGDTDEPALLVRESAGL